METLTNIPWALVAPLLILQLVLAAVAIVDIVRAHETRGPKWLWILISLFMNTIGPILYFIIGRKNQ
ncbi:transcriptional regulator [Lysinibacillus sp. 2017]|uniref:PLD nuclease N-terminal domain-containing protein n=1 Tax=unclassified Lysinibacillus TaxID=2636778 RepID=UPI000D527ED4|nr:MULTISPECIES: PLD nuclease N-terminal domain-containing protein [unclassified Lysinibacillus]AWE05996.1 transcriptional regulator [Lysinibacillus sp. 2017]TGN34779.1 PLDc_N domain-containing protein [Lysinibacillus sp. S2017]